MYLKFIIFHCLLYVLKTSEIYVELEKLIHTKRRNNLKIMVNCDKKNRLPKKLCASSERIFSKHGCHIAANTCLVSAK